MYKLNLAIMALLCLALTSCEKESLDSSDDFDLQISVRSSDNVIVSYDTPTATGEITSCNLAEVNFLSAAWADLILTSSSGVVQVQANNIIFSEADGDELQAVDTNGSLHYSVGFIADPCDAQLCLDGGGNVLTDLGFIVEDDPRGL